MYYTSVHPHEYIHGVPVIFEGIERGIVDDLHRLGVNECRSGGVKKRQRHLGT